VLRYVDEQTIAGVRCDHLVGRRKNVDFQVWISQSEPPVFERLIITYARRATATVFEIWGKIDF
jgi:hypothetical protein